MTRTLILVPAGSCVGKKRKEAKRFSLSGAVDREQIQWLQWSRERRRQLLLVSILRMFKVVSGI